MNGCTTGGGGPCGACKFLRRKCVSECVFAPYFDSEEGTSHFAAVHKVFGASNASKLLMMIPASRRLDAVVTLCYEALARLRDPVYGCVGHIYALQHQTMNLQAELAYVQTQLSALQQQRLLPPITPQNNSPTTEAASSSFIAGPLNSSSVDNKSNIVSCSSSSHIHRVQLKEVIEGSRESVDLSSLLGLEDPAAEGDGDDLNALAREFVSKYLTGSQCRPSSPI